MGQSFLLDTNVFVEAHKRYYARDICPGFWDCLLRECQNGSLMSIDKVRSEIEEGRDELWNWVKGHTPQNFFVATTEQSVQDTYSGIMEWIHTQNFNPNAISSFAGGADGWLVAYTRVHGMVLVTDEKFNPQIRRRVPIPNVCRQFEVDYIDTFRMLRELEVQFQ